MGLGTVSAAFISVAWMEPSSTALGKTKGNHLWGQAEGPEGQSGGHQPKGSFPIGTGC